MSVNNTVATNPVVGYLGLLAGQELGDRLERRSPVGFDEVDSVAPRELNVLRARYAIGDVLAPCGQEHHVVGVLDDESLYAERSRAGRLSRTLALVMPLASVASVLGRRCAETLTA